MKAIFTILFFCILGTFSGCMKKPPPDPSLKSSIINCSGNNAWTVDALTKSISGNWHVYQETGGAQAYDNIALYFGPDKILTVTHGTQLVAQAPFIIKTSNGTDFFIETAGDGQAYVSGALYLCDNHMLCSSAPADGPDYLYQRY